MARSEWEAKPPTILAIEAGQGKAEMACSEPL